MISSAPNAVAETSFRGRTLQNEELRRAQAEIEAARARYFDLYELAPVGYCTLSEPGLILEANLTAARLLGLARGALTGQPLSRFIAREDQDVFYLFRKSLFAAQGGASADSGTDAESQVCSLRMMKADGAALWVRFEAVIAAEAEGSPVCRLTISDITLSKEMDALRESKERLTLALDAAQLGTYDWDIAANRILWSQRHESLWGFVSGAFDGTYEGFLSRLHPDDATGVSEELARGMTTGERFSRDFRVVWPDGSLHWMQGLGEFSVDSTGKPQRMRGCVMEITARKEAELELRRFQQIVETSRDMLLFVDRDLRYQVVNPAYAERFQVTPRALQGCLVSEVVGEDLYARIAPELEAALSGETRRFSIEIAGPDGQRLDLEATYAPFWQNGRVQGIVVCLHDVTETKAAWAALEAERTHLEDLVAERTAALRASEGMLRIIFDLQPIGISITDRSGQVVDCNPASERLLGITREEHLRRNFAGPEWTIIRPDGAPLSADAYASVRAMVEQRPVRDQEVGIVKPDGLTWLSVSAMPTDHPDYGVVVAYVDISARRQGEAALRASEQRWQFALEGAGDGVWDWDISSDRVFFSHRWKAMLGYSDEEIENLPGAWKQHVHPEDLPRALVDVQAHLEGKTPLYVNEHRMRCEDGRWKWILARGKVMERGADGQPLRMIGTHTDISERRAADHALRESEQRFRAMFMNAPLCILIHDADTAEMLDANPTACAQYGFDSVEALKSASPQLWLEPPYSADDAVKWHAKTLQEGPQQFEWHYRCANGNTIWEWVHLSTIEMQGKTHILAMTVDITGDKQLKADLQASEARARAIIDAAPVPMAIAYESGAVTYLNPAFIETFGYTLEDIPTWSDWRLKAFPDPDDRQRVVDLRRQALQRVTHNGRVCEPTELTVCCKDGQRRALMAFAAPLETSPEILYLNTFYDVTDLNNAREAAEQAARVKSEFLTNMSHEIRTPLNAMLGLAQLLEGEALSAEQCHLVQRLREAGKTLLALVNDILDVSKLAAGQLRLTASTFSPAAVLAQVASLMGQQARSKGLDFRLEMPADLAAWLRGDPLRLEQILVNLVGNAVKFTEQGEVRIQVSQADMDVQQVRLRLEVHDTGIGISPEDQATLGTAFRQADGSITRRFGGTGLGLAISQQLVERMEGTFGVDSTLGVGSTFWCELPFERASADDRPSDEVAPEAWLGGPRLSGVHCLVVDDSSLNQEVVEHALRREGARATLLVDGQQAVDWLRAHSQDVDAVLMDIQMPVMDGLTATRAIRQALGLTELPVIAFSAGVLDEQRQQAQEAGLSDFLAKPVDLEELVVVLQRWLKTPATEAASPSGIPTATLSGAPRTDFPDIPGLDTREAARLLGNDWSLFVKLLPPLITDFRDIAQRTRDDLARGAIDAAARRIHSMRGRAGYLGARDLIRTARTLEQRLLEGNTDVEDLINAFEGQLTALLAALTPWLEDRTQPAPQEATRLDPTQLAALQAALARCDLAALALFEALEPALVRRDGQAATAALAEAIRSLRFDEALALLTSAP
ncbi:PAS domain S-box protein [Thiorhodococcus mannitoliphagus]|uniref:PAS domain S-box protein n=1 Tax=Thiorhodococcus mannitoliphagus TaxID=329406 RepID=UPI0019823ED3|nr:PAS domain S-box protein [Thiorhodococcus mannitoliphagus]